MSEFQQIPLRGKYRRATKGRFKGGEKPAPPKHRKKIGGLKHIAKHGEQPTMTRRIDLATGHTRMERVEEGS